MELAKKILAGILLVVLAAAWLGSVAITFIIVLPAGWYWALVQCATAAVALPVVWEFCVILYRVIVPKK